MMDDSTQKRKQFHRYLLRVLEMAVVLGFIIVVATLLVFAMKYIMPFVIGWILAILLIPAVRIFEQRGLGRFTSVIIVMGSTVIALVAAMIGLVIGIAREAVMLSTNSNTYFHYVNTWFGNKMALGRVFYSKLPVDVAEKMQSALVGTLNSFEKGFKSFAAFLLTAVTHVPESLFVVVIALITTFIVLVHRERMMNGFLAVLPPGWSGKFHSVLEAMTRAFVGSIRVQMILMLLSAVLGVAGMLILHFPYAIILGLLFGLSGIVPILGSAILTVPWAIGALVIGDASTAIKLILLQIVVSIIRHLIEPKILANSVGLDTLSALFGLYVGMKTLGVLGLFLGPIILIGVKTLFATHLFIDFLPAYSDIGAREEANGKSPISSELDTATLVMQQRDENHD